MVFYIHSFQIYSFNALCVNGSSELKDPNVSLILLCPFLNAVYITMTGSPELTLIINLFKRPVFVSRLLFPDPGGELPGSDRSSDEGKNLR